MLITENIENRVRIVAASSCSSACPLGLASMTAGHIYLVAGNGTAGYTGDNHPATSAELSDPYGVGSDAKGDLLIADGGDAAVRMVGRLSLLVGLPVRPRLDGRRGHLHRCPHGGWVSGLPDRRHRRLGGDLLIADSGSASVRLVAGAYLLVPRARSACRRPPPGGCMS